METETPSEQLHLIKPSENITSPGEQILTITDPDSIEMLESAPAGQIRALTEKRLLRLQKERNEKAEKRSEMTPIQRRRDVVSERLKELHYKIVTSTISTAFSPSVRCLTNAQKRTAWTTKPVMAICP